MPWSDDASGLIPSNKKPKHKKLFPSFSQHKTCYNGWKSEKPSINMPELTPSITAFSPLIYPHFLFHLKHEEEQILVAVAIAHPGDPQ